MKQPLKSGKQTILYDGFILSVYRSFFKNLLHLQQVKNKKGYYFQKSSNAPKNTIFLKSYLKAHYAYEDFQYIMQLYQFVSNNSFYNLCCYLEENKIYSLSSNSLYDCYEKSKNLKNDLKNLNTIIAPLKFLKSINGEKQNG